uniref:F-box domain-containing protein n=1 Tax=Catharus ustulatus TaxID=91951 RepID=A0A8C3TTU8_CATUS
MAARPPLPDSVLVQVLALLPLRDRLRAARVCRRWQQLAQDRAVWTHVDLSPHRYTSSAFFFFFCIGLKMLLFFVFPHKYVKELVM